MSWQGYVDNLVQQEVPKSGIYGLEGTPWHDTTKACSINASQGEMNILIGALTGTQSALTSFKLEGQEYSVINMVQGDFVLAKTKGGAAEDKGLLYCAKGKSYAMVAFKKGAGERDVVRVVEKLKEHIDNNMWMIFAILFLFCFVLFVCLFFFLNRKLSIQKYIWAYDVYEISIKEILDYRTVD